MPGFLDSIGEIVGGFNAQRRIDKEGFDWREQAAQAELAREQQEKQWQQGNEDWATKTGAEALVGGMSDQDLAGILPSDVNRERVKWRAGGLAQQAKSALADQKYWIDRRRSEQDFGETVKLQGLRADEEEKRIRLREELQRTRTLSPEKQAMLDSLERRAREHEQAANYRAANFGASGRPRILKVPGTDAEGNAGTVLYDQNNMAAGPVGFEKAGATAGTRGRKEAVGLAMNAYEYIRGLRAQLPTPDSWIAAQAVGAAREIGAKTQANPHATAHKASIRGFAPLMARAIGHVGVLTELDVERTEQLFSGLNATAETDQLLDQTFRGIMSGKIPLPFQLGEGGGKPIAYIDEQGNISDFSGRGQAPPASPRPGAVPPPPGAGQERMVKYQGRTVPLSSLPPELQALVK